MMSSLSASISNPAPASSCMYLSVWASSSEKNHHNWIDDEEEEEEEGQENEEFYSSQITAPQIYNKESNRFSGIRPCLKKRDKREKEYKHVPHKDKPAHVVAKRNARERKRVQAVNSAFVKLRKVIPIENVRGKRISKVKTLQYAIDYIHSLQDILEQDDSYDNTIFCQYYEMGKGPSSREYLDRFHYYPYPQKM